MQLSVLDLAPVTAQDTAADALRRTVDLARTAERLGYARYWFAEHHNMPSIASSAPEILIGHIAGATKRIRVGSGGVMLPNHVPLQVAERFHTLQALYPGRIDLGIGRAPGTDPVTSQALTVFWWRELSATPGGAARPLCRYPARRPSVSRGQGRAERRHLAADLAAGLERGQR